MAFLDRKIDGAEHVLITGPITGAVELADGTVYDVSADVIAVDSEEHAKELAHHIAVQHEQAGHPGHDTAEPFVHLCTDDCGPAKRAASHPQQKIAVERAKEQLALVPDTEQRAQLAKQMGVKL